MARHWGITPCWMYVLRCVDLSLYCGIAENPEDRLKRHNAGRGSKYVRSRRPAIIVASKLYNNRSEALRAEAAFKKLTKIEKERFVEDQSHNPE